MQVTVHYLAQLRRAAGCTTERLDVEAGLTAGELCRRLGDLHGEPFRTLIQGAEGRPHPSLLVFIGEQLIEWSRVLHDGDEVTMLTPMSGG